ncbi:hypothetical protein [Salinarimonas sp.]|uniref:hypothetical protein n=1 Tax=Salinarimonas sp. TaxID=2766526 RepID=UPI00391DD842
MSSDNVVRKKRGRPATGQDPVTAIRLSAEMREGLDRAARLEPDRPSRSALIRRIVSDWLRERGLIGGEGR